MKYLRLFRQLGQMNFSKQLIYPASFWLALVGKSLRVGIEVLFFTAVYLKTPRIGEWTFWEILFLFSTFGLVQTLGSITYHRNLAYWFPESLRKGTFELRSVQPVPSLFYESFRLIDFMDLFSLIPVLFVFLLAWQKLNLSIFSIATLGYLFFLFISYFFVYAIFILVSSLYFREFFGHGLGRLLESVINIGRYPMDIFGGFLGIIVRYIFPLAIIATFPTSQLLYGFQPFYAIFAFLFTIVFLAFAIFTWNRALRSYAGVSN